MTSGVFLVGPGIVILLLGLMPTPADAANKNITMMPIQQSTVRLKEHLTVLTQTIGERSIYRPENLKKAETYIRTIFQNIGLNPRSQTYRYQQKGEESPARSF